VTLQAMPQHKRVTHMVVFIRSMNMRYSAVVYVSGQACARVLILLYKLSVGRLCLPVRH
jgi:hypothetical protein